ncbi:MAG: hypothetical protein V2A78_02075 [bacterium]
MALIKHGSFYKFSAAATKKAQADHAAIGALQTFSDLREVTRTVQPVPINFHTSNAPRGLALKSIKLTKGFEGFLQSLFNRTNEVFFLSWAWDLSGNPPVKYPGLGAEPQSCIIPLQVGQVRQFLGSGILLSPARTITAGLAVRIMLWESDQGERDFGKTMTEVANTLKTSELTNLLALIAMGVVDVPVSIITTVAAAAGELAKAVGSILQANGDDYVDFYEGYYPSTDPWAAGDETHQGSASEITLTRLP